MAPVSGVYPEHGDRDVFRRPPVATGNHAVKKIQIHESMEDGITHQNRHRLTNLASARSFESIVCIHYKSCCSAEGTATIVRVAGLL